MSISIKIKPLAIVGGTGSGRSTLISQLQKNNPQKFQSLVSHTTRRPRPSEVNGKNFYFVSQNWMIENKQRFLTFTLSGSNNYYGLAREEVHRILNKDKIPIFKITLDAFLKNIGNNGKILFEKEHPETGKEEESKAEEGETNYFFKLMKKHTESLSLHFLKDEKIECNSLYIKPPSVAQLQKRLQFTPFTFEQKKLKIQRALKEHKQSCKYFEEEYILGKRSKNQQISQLNEEIVRLAQSRLFWLY